MTDTSATVPARTYLDDPDLPLQLDPVDIGSDADTVLAELLRRDPEQGDLALIVRGAAMLLTADAGTAAECLATSMTWLYG